MAKSCMRKLNLKKVILYNETSSKNFNHYEIGEYIKEMIPSSHVEFRKQFFNPRNDTAVELARIKVRNLYSVSFNQPLYGEIEFEKKILEDPDKASPAVLYDGMRLQQITRESILKGERNMDYLHIVFTKRFFASFDDNDRRYHARVAIFAFPNLISTTGVVEAPAKPKKYYELRNKFSNLGLAFVENKLKEEFHGQFIDYEDERMTQVMKGYSLQAIFYHLFHQPFCLDKNCQLYNGHWQEEVIHAHVKSGRLCSYHDEMLRRYTSEN